MGNKSTKIEITQRINDIMTMLVKGASRQDILQYASDQWGITERQTDTYIKRASDQLTASFKSEREEMTALALARMTLLFQMNLKVMDFKGALAAQREINRLFGLYAPTRNEHTGKDGNALEITLVYPD